MNTSSYTMSQNRINTRTEERKAEELHLMTHSNSTAFNFGQQRKKEPNSFGKGKNLRPNMRQIQSL
jgi:hypothetical protein